MFLRFTKGPVAAKTDLLTCVRSDGSITSGEMPRQGILPHDAFHFVVESTLGWRDAFFGHIARGATLDQMEAKRTGNRPTWAGLPVALQAESLVECLQAEQWGGAADPTTFRATLVVTCRARGVTAPRVSDEDLRLVRVALREFGAVWRPLLPGQSLEREWKEK
jgi:hypothetical protein